MSRHAGRSRQYLTAINSREHLHAFAGVPLKLQGNTAGVLAVYRRRCPCLSRERIATSAHIADQAAVAMERARLYEQERHTIGELRMLHTQIERNTELFERATAVHDQLTQMVLQDAGLDAIVDSLARTLGTPVAVEDQFRHRVAQGPREPASATGNSDVEATASTRKRLWMTPKCGSSSMRFGSRTAR